MITSSSNAATAVKPDLRCRQHGFSLIELLALMFIFTITMVAEELVAESYGLTWGIIAAVIAFMAGAALVVLWYRWTWRRDKARLRELKERYQSIYRVLALPGDKSGIVKLVGAEIRIGDFGWEAAPIRNDGLIHLQGLTPSWNVVWHASFRPEEIQLVGPKPSSQYDYWVPDWAKPDEPPVSPCPYPILERATPAMERPHHSLYYFTPPGQQMEGEH